MTVDYGSKRGKKKKKKRMSSVPTMMKEEMGLAIKGEG